MVNSFCTGYKYEEQQTELKDDRRQNYRAPHVHSLRTWTAGIVALTSAWCLLAEADTTARENCAVAWRDRGEVPSGTEYGGSRFLHLGSVVALGVHLAVHCVSFE